MHATPPALTIARAMSTKGPGRPRSNSIHSLYTKKAGCKPTDPVYTCVGCEEEVKGKLTINLIKHAQNCPSLTAEQKEDARLAFNEYEDKKKATNLVDFTRTDSGSSATVHKEQSSVQESDRLPHHL